MKKLIIILTIALWNISIANAQNYVPFPEQNATWITMTAEYGSGRYFYYYYKYFLLEHDTVYNQQNYHVMYAQMYNQPPIMLGGLRNEGKKVFFRFFNPLPTSWIRYDLGFSPQDTTEFILYDFDINIGDTINHCFDKPYLLNIDTITLQNNEERKRYLLANYYSQIIEGIGNTNGLFWNCGSTNVSNFTTSLICFSRNNGNNLLDTTFMSGECLLISSIEKKYKREANSNINIYPNPATNQLAISYASIPQHDNKVEIYNAVGVKILEVIGKKLDASIPQHDSIVEIDISEFPKDLYFVKIGNENLKFIKE